MIPIDEALKAGSKRIEDLAPTFRVVASRPAAPPHLVVQVQAAVEKARRASEVAGAAFLEKHRSKEDGIVHDVCGTADVVMHDSTSPVTAALLDAQLAHGSGAEYYVVDAIGKLAGDQALSYRSAAADAACACLNSELGDLFSVKSWWD